MVRPLRLARVAQLASSLKSRSSNPPVEARLLLLGLQPRRVGVSSSRPPIDVSRPPAPEERIPVTILTGFLGSGKTTLLNHILSSSHGLRLAVIQNEFGEVGVDHLLTAEHFESDEEIFQLNNGCLCCSVRSDLAPIVEKLFLSQGKTGRLDGIIVETTGLAVPGPVLQTFLRDSPAMLTRLDAVVTVVDAVNVSHHFSRAREALARVTPPGLGAPDLSRWLGEAAKRPIEPNECVEQVAFADVLLLNKCDLVDEDRMEELEAELRSVNPYAEILRCQKANVPLDRLFHLRSFELDRILHRQLVMEDGTHRDGHGHDHGHGPAHMHGSNPGSSEPAGSSAVLVEGRHSSSVTSVSILHQGTMDMQRLEQWMGKLLEHHGEHIYRMKGVLAIAGANEMLDQKLVYHGVHMLFQGDIMGEYADGELRESRLVFIGRGLDGEVIRNGFLECTAVAEPGTGSLP